MPLFADRAWVEMSHRFNYRTTRVVSHGETRDAMQEVFEGWDMVIAYVPEEELRRTVPLSPPSSMDRIPAHIRHFFVFRHPTMAAAVSLNPYTRYTRSNGRLGWLSWESTAPLARAERIRYALQGASLVSPTLMGLADQMVALQSSDDEEDRINGAVWQGHALRLVPAGLAELAPEERATFQMLAGLGAYDH
jgi:hypothetical protein